MLRQRYSRNWAKGWWLPHGIAAMAWVALWLGLIMPAVAVAAISGNQQVALAGAGKFAELAGHLEEQAAKEPMKVADWHALCYANFRMKRYDKISPCLDRMEKALVAYDKRTRLFGLEDATPTVYLMRAETYLEIGQYALAVQTAQRAIDWYVKDGSAEKDILIQALAVQAIAYKNSEQIDLAEQAADKLDAVKVPMLGDDAIGAKSLAVARVSMALGRWQATLDALASDKTLGLRTFLDNIATGAFLRGINNWLWLELPRGYMFNKAKFELGKLEEARVGYDQLLKTPQVAANGEIHWMLMADRAQIAEADNALDLAISLNTKALDVIEQQRASINTEANKIGFIGDKQAVYARLIDLLFKTGRMDEALQVVERAKSRALVDLLASKTNFTAPREARSDKLDVVEMVQERFSADQTLREQSEVTARNIVAGIVRQDSRQVVLPGELQSLLSVKASSPAEIQQLLAEDENLLTYFSHGKRMFVLLVQKDRVIGSPVDQNGLESEVRKLRSNLSQQLPVDALLQQLYKRLLAPVATQIRGKKLTIVAHGALHYLPFSALHDGNQYLADQFSLRMLPSASVLKYIRPSGSKDLSSSLVLGNPDLMDTRMNLPGAESEASALAKALPSDKLLLRAEASKEAFLRLAPASRYIHVASHGEFDSSKPLSSGLLLASVTRGQGRVTVSDLYQLALDAELVTLSACDTGLGRIASGDDVVGLTRGFLYAGTSSVLASLWQVDDDSTTFLMLRFYEHLRSTNKAEALRQAQRDTRARFNHPYFWAPFYLTGAD